MVGHQTATHSGLPPDLGQRRPGVSALREEPNSRLDQTSTRFRGSLSLCPPLCHNDILRSTARTPGQPARVPPLTWIV